MAQAYGPGLAGFGHGLARLERSPEAGPTGSAPSAHGPGLSISSRPGSSFYCVFCFLGLWARGGRPDWGLGLGRGSGFGIGVPEAGADLGSQTVGGSGEPK